MKVIARTVSYWNNTVIKWYTVSLYNTNCIKMLHVSSWNTWCINRIHFRLIGLLCYDLTNSCYFMNTDSFLLAKNEYQFISFVNELKWIKIHFVSKRNKNEYQFISFVNELKWIKIHFVIWQNVIMNSYSIRVTFVLFRVALATM